MAIEYVSSSFLKLKKTCFNIQSHYGPLMADVSMGEGIKELRYTIEDLLHTYTCV